MDQKRLSVYLRSLEEDYPEYLQKTEDDALRNRIPIIRRETASFLCTLLTMKPPRRILEVGTAVGYSASVMALATDHRTPITTIEKSPVNAAAARENLERGRRYRLAAGQPAAEITLLEGDAADVLKTLTGTFDFIFMDAAKGQYLIWLPRILELLEPGGVLVTDNVLQEGTLLESRYAVTRRDRTIHARMREYLWQLKHDESLSTSILNVGDGVALTYRRVL